MTYLLDVNALLALGVRKHVFHGRMLAWLAGMAPSAVSRVATCAITELGFVRVLSQARQYGLSLEEARGLLGQLKTAQSLPFVFIADDHDVSRLPSWVASPNQTTDGHLVELAKAHGAQFGTLDEHIPSAYIIPHGS